MKQGQYHPLTVPEMAVSLFAANEGYIDDVEVEKVTDFEKALHEYMAAEHKALMDRMAAELELTDEIERGLRKAIEDFKAHHAY